MFASRVEAKKVNTNCFLGNLLWKKVRINSHIANGVDLLGKTRSAICIFDIKVKTS